MITQKLIPRFNDTDALGHINNASYLSWFEDARRPIFKIFIPDLDPGKWNLILARVEIDYLSQGDYQQGLEIQTELEKIGNSSMTLIQTAIQKGTPLARAKSIMVYFNYATNSSERIPDVYREQLSNI